MPQPPARYGLEDVVACLDRELKLRKRLYPGRVRNHRMTQKAADREIAIMQQIYDDHVMALRLQSTEEGRDLFIRSGEIFGSAVKKMQKGG